MTGGSSACGKRSTDSGSASASARVHWSVTRQLIFPPRACSGRGTSEAGGGAPPSRLRRATSPSKLEEDFLSSSLPRLLGQPRVQLLGQGRRIILAAIGVEQRLLPDHPFLHRAGGRMGRQQD